MPHIVVKLVSGKSDEQKARLADAITRDVVQILNYSEDAISLAFEEFASEDWAEKVYRPDIKGKWDTLYKKPGYTV